MATKTTISTLTLLELAEAILDYCNGFIFAAILWDFVTDKLSNNNISASTDEILEALRYLINVDRLLLRDIVLTGKEINIRLEFVKKV